jgi:hypothetical protein
MPKDAELETLARLVGRVPSVTGPIGTGCTADGCWWLKFAIDIGHPLSWRAVQELAHVLNYVSLDERLPTVFMPVSPPPYMNGGPREFLSWVIEARDPAFGARECAEWLEGRLPRPLDDPAAWKLDD